MNFLVKNLKKGLVLLLVVAFMVSALSGCSKTPEKVIKVGSKDFTEQLILGQLTLLALENAGFKVEDKTNVAGSDKVRKALENDEIDIYWEYTGTAWLVHLQHDEAITDSEECYQKVKEEDAKNGMVWLQYAPLNNTYTIMMRKKDSDELGIKSLSELSAYMKEHPNTLTFAGDHEFTIRPDGFPALQEHYGFQFGEDHLKVMEMGIIYKSLKENKVQVGMGTATDGRIAAYDLINLEDDKKFFPVYNAVPVLKKETLDKYPEIADIMNKISAKLDTSTMTQLNYQVDIKEREPREVAEEWLKSQGLIE